MSSSITLYRAPYLPGNDLGNQTSETLMPNGRGTSLVLPLPSNGSLANRRFRVVVSGRVQTSLNSTFTVNVYFGFSPTLSSNTLIFSTGAVAVNSSNTGFSFTIDMFWSATGLTVNGVGEGQSNNNPVGRIAMANTIPNVDPFHDNNPNSITYGFSATGTFGSSSAANHAFIDLFELEAL